ncbi:SCP2 sterol-binding domain-containing protein [Roseospira marina]|uniref:SCP2 sterol-binding domain-containing protein n=1 Tax=Roseospira marina TaxID=140057 RepID=A0A5M6IFC2_9PROT|nr:SCP2 sterol-binding domain-containing protein [Roseospira marina]KAA5606986.1 SCP2 sterol-binding domain-containing protein [Roseospira marina]MBB4312833.1 putative lipid carrier protein YhbT [Roseospira marina]MBB5086394.1 putative lipid carrier protein YhbT [Roseospira marina]
MSQSVRTFSPGLLLGLLIRPIPLSALRVVARPVMDGLIADLGPRLGDRLSGLQGRLAIVPTGHPVAVVLDIDDGALELDLIEADTREAMGAVAAVRAPLETLTAMLDTEGMDGDASFFARALTIEGDTSLVMALRYALEDAGAGIDDITNAMPWPFGAALPHAMRFGQRVHAAASRDLATIQDAILAPVRTEVARQDARMSRMESQMQRTQRRRAAS